MKLQLHWLQMFLGVEIWATVVGFIGYLFNHQIGTFFWWVQLITGIGFVAGWIVKKALIKKKEPAA